MKKTVFGLSLAIAATACCFGSGHAATSEELAAALLTENSLPITFTDDETHPWTVNNEGTGVTSSNFDSNTSSTLTATFTIDKPSRLSYYRRLSSSTSYHNITCRIDGADFDVTTSETYLSPRATVLEPGTHTVTWTYNRSNTSSTSYYAEIASIMIRENWIDVDVATPGSLGVEVLYKVKALQDVEMLRVTGALNADDLATFKQMANLYAADLSGASFSTVPASAFAKMSRLSYITLPEGIEAIGNNAFQSTNLRSITIPASVKQIGNQAFYQSNVSAVNFAEGSQLSYIGGEAFYNCNWLQELIMPNSVTNLGISSNYYYGEKRSYTFNECTRLKRLVISDAITDIPSYTCNNCKALAELHLPAQLQTIGDYAFYYVNSLESLEFPETLRTIGKYAFYGLHKCPSVNIPVRTSSIGMQAFGDGSGLTHVELPSNATSYDNTFYSCPNIKTIVCRSATPPAITNDPFSGLTKSAVTLKAPAFAVVNYKLDSYWYQFGNIEELSGEDDPGYWNIAGNLMLTNNRRIDGTPDIDLNYGAALTVGGSAPMTVGTLNIYMSETNPARMLNSCDAFTADNLNVYFSVNANTWYFITPMADVDLADVTVNSTESFVFRYYDGASRAATGTGSSWRNVTDSQLKAGQGYIFQCNTNGVIKFPIAAVAQSQILGIEPVSIELADHASDNAANAGWNYVGNPYPCYYDVYYMDFTAPITVWDSNYNTYKAYSIADDNYVLRPMQAFFVQKPEGVSAIAMHAGGKQLSTAVSRAAKAQANAFDSGCARSIFNLEITSGNLSDGTRVVLNDAASLSYEIACDASKFMSISPSTPQIYTIDSDGNRLAINERPLTDGSVRLGVYVPAANTPCTIGVTRTDGKIMLHDSLTGTVTDLTTGSYTFTSENGGEIDNRFTITLEYAKPAGIGAIEADDVTATGATGYAEITAPAGTAVTVCTTTGTIAASFTANGQPQHVDLAAGLYIITAGNTSFKAIVR